MQNIIKVLMILFALVLAACDKKYEECLAKCGDEYDSCRSIKTNTDCEKRFDECSRVCLKRYSGGWI